MTTDDETPSYGGSAVDDDGHQSRDSDNDSLQSTDPTRERAAEPMQPSGSARHGDDSARQHSDSARHGDDSARQHSDSHPLPWLALDYGTFETDEDAPSLDENAPSLDEELVGQTGFDPSDADEPARWEWLKELNNGRGDSDRNTQLRNAGIQRDIDVVCDRLGCTDHQKERAQWLLDEVDIQGQLLPSGPIEIAIIGVVSMVIDEDRTRFARMPGVDNVYSVTRDEEFEQLCRDFDVDRSRIHDVRQRLRDTEVYQSANDH